MTDKDPIVYDSFDVDDQGRVTGSVHTREKEGHTVQAGVSSYDYERHGETHMNHVPNVVVTGPDGSIVAEPYAHDSKSAEKAMQNARGTARSVFDNLQDYID